MFFLFLYLGRDDVEQLLDERVAARHVAREELFFGVMYVYVLLYMCVCVLNAFCLCVCIYKCVCVFFMFGYVYVCM